MPRLRVYKAEGGDTFSPRLRVLDAGGSGDVAILSPRLRVFNTAGSGVVPVTPNLRILGISGSGVASLVVAPLAALAGVEPESPVTITAVSTIGMPDGWVWRQISGPTLAMSTSGATVTFPAPSSMSGVTVMLGVTATSASVVSAERTVSVQVLPQTQWAYVGGVWRGQAAIWL